MKIYVNIKNAGRRKPVLEKEEYVIADGVKSVMEFIAAVVSCEVEKFNLKLKEGSDDGESVAKSAFIMTNEEINEKAQVGKVGFGRIYSNKDADYDKALKNALQCYDDGLVKIFQNDNELGEQQSEMVVREGDVFTFVKLTFLAGRYW